MAADKTSKSQEKRKSSKPLMEKRRRARINECLSKLQSILEVVNGHSETPGGHSKREKAEILEQTVQLVKHLRQQEQGGQTREVLPIAQYRAGFNECLNEVSRFMDVNERALNAETRAGLLNHLASSMQTPASAPPASPSNGVGTGSSGWNTGQFVQQSPRKATLPEERVDGRGVGRRGSTVVQPVNPMPPPDAVTPSHAGAASASNYPTRISSSNNPTLPPTQQHPLRMVQPQKSPVIIPASQGVALPINLQSPPAGHVAVVLPAHLLGSFVGGQVATGQLIPLYQQQGSAPVASQRAPSSELVTIPPGSSAMFVPTPGNNRDVNHVDPTVGSSSNSRGGRVFVAPSPVPGCSPNMGSTSVRIESSALANPERRVPVATNPPITPSGVETMAAKGTPEHGIIYAPASLPMQFYVAPSAYGAVSGPFPNGLALANPPSLALDAIGGHWRPWGLEQNQR
ncbi:uncharacterized protein [Asterias amurensis]|uniref:uncharacterized protein n=1 Tax=Asterias amurensis TaxID=7602 RepID=UPI003AB86E45